MSTHTEDGAPVGHGRARLVALPDAAGRRLLDDVMRGLADIAAGRTEDAKTALTRLRKGLAHRPQS